MIIQVLDGKGRWEDLTLDINSIRIVQMKGVFKEKAITIQEELEAEQILRMYKVSINDNDQLQIRPESANAIVIV